MPSLRPLFAASILISAFAGPSLAAAPQSLLVDLESTPIPAGSNPQEFVAFGGSTYFFAVQEEQTQLWSSDGTEAGTQLVRTWPVASIALNSRTEVTVFNGALYFWMFDLETGREVWKSDGTTAGTVLLADLYPGSVSANQSTSDSDFEFVEHGGLLYFAARSPAFGTELWRTDGTGSGTVLVSDVQPGSLGSDPTELVSFGPHLYFFAGSSSSQKALYRTDGTAPGTVQVYAFDAVSPSMDPPSGLHVLGGQLVFAAFEAGVGHELWASDGSTAGTAPYSTILPGGLAEPVQFQQVGSLLYFAAESDAVPGKSLHRTDGTNAGTFELSSHETFANGRLGAGELVFAVFGALGDREIWRTDGTVAGTTFVDVLPGLLTPQDFCWSPAGTYYFTTQSFSNPLQTLWRTDGVPGGAQALGQWADPGSSGQGWDGTRFWFGRADAMAGVVFRILKKNRTPLLRYDS